MEFSVVFCAGRGYNGPVKRWFQQLDASEVVGLLPPVFQPEAVLVIPKEGLPGDAYQDVYKRQYLKQWSK